MLGKQQVVTLHTQDCDCRSNTGPRHILYAGVQQLYFMMQIWRKADTAVYPQAGDHSCTSCQHRFPLSCLPACHSETPRASAVPACMLLLCELQHAVLEREALTKTLIRDCKTFNVKLSKRVTLHLSLGMLCCFKQAVKTR